MKGAITMSTLLGFIIFIAAVLVLGAALVSALDSGDYCEESLSYLSEINSSEKAM